jgi:hypothetical protein
MLDVTTTITINGPAGERFLSSLAAYEAPVPRALHYLASSDYRSIEVDRNDAELIAQFVDHLLASGWLHLEEPPLLYSACVGDHVMFARDVLAELGREAAGLPPTWLLVPGGTRGTLLGWRDRECDSRAIIDLLGVDHRTVVFVGERSVTRAVTQVANRPRPAARRRRPSRHGR